jgi:type IV pilus assembly protein PilA
MINFSKEKQGFTLIELLVVIAIIGILATIVVVNVNNARLKAKDAVIRTHIDQMRVTAEMYYDSASGGNGDYDSFCFNADYNQLINAMSAAGGSEINCAAGGQVYCVSVRAPIAGILCRDSNGKLGGAACNVVGNFCP